MSVLELALLYLGRGSFSELGRSKTALLLRYRMTRSVKQGSWISNVVKDSFSTLAASGINRCRVMRLAICRSGDESRLQYGVIACTNRMIGLLLAYL